MMVIIENNTLLLMEKMIAVKIKSAFCLVSKVFFIFPRNIQPIQRRQTLAGFNRRKNIDRIGEFSYFPRLEGKIKDFLRSFVPEW